MPRRTLQVLVMLGTLTIYGQTQSFCGNGSHKLACEIPYATHVPVTNLAGLVFNSTFATQLSQLPLASASTGITFTFDKSGIPKLSNDSLGPVYLERGNTVGRHKLFLGFTYQRFAFDDIDGLDLNHISLVAITPKSLGSGITYNIYNSSTSRIDAKIDQYVARATFGVTSWLDVSVAVPFERVSLRTSTKGTEYFVAGNQSIGAPANYGPNTNPGSASGVGDVVVSTKVRLASLRDNSINFAAGLDFRVPTGDEFNYLGTGAIGYKPYLVFSRNGRFSQHVNLGFQVNGVSDIYTPLIKSNQNNNPVFYPSKQQPNLPNTLTYSGGVDYGVTRNLTLIADILGQRFISAPTLAISSVPCSACGSSYNGASAVPANGNPQLKTYSADNLSVGVKLRPWKRLVLTGNALIKLDDGGIRSKVTPLGGVSYTF